MGVSTLLWNTCRRPSRQRFWVAARSAAWTLEARRGLRAAAVTVENPHSALIVRKGHEHEAACLAALREEHGDFVESRLAAWRHASRRPSRRWSVALP